MKEVNIRLTSGKGASRETASFTVAVPESTGWVEIYTELNRCHEKLCSENGSGKDHADGICPQALMEHVCEKNGWKYCRFSFDIDLALE